jgi:hypothetical protein
MAVIVGMLAAASAAVASPPVSVFPTPGSRYARPATQISFRGIAPGQIGPVRVTGSATGVHTGHLAAHSDGSGASFLPDKPFAGGETVTVGTNLNVLGAGNGSFSFTVAQAVGLLPYGSLPLVPAGANGTQHFRSWPDLRPASVTVTKNTAPASYGDIFVAPQFGPSQDGPMILDPQGHLVWFLPYSVKRNTLITDFRVQQLFGQPVLTWWQGNTNSGHGRGEGVIYDSSYRQIATVHAADGLDAGLHEFMITPDGDAYMTASSPVRLPGVGKPAVDSVVQEVDIRTGLVLFEWHSMDHIPLSDSYFSPHSPGHIFDPFHVNSIALDSDGNLLVSMRNTSAVYEIDHQTGSVIWVLGGKHSSFRMGRGTPTWGQHAAIVQPDGTLTIFDDGAGPPRVHPHSRGIRVALDGAHMAASLVQEYDHSPQLSSNFEGNVQQLPGGDVFMGWGQQPYFSEDNRKGQQDFDAHFTVPTSSYRAYRFPWSGNPPGRPDVAMWAGGAGVIHVYASWNGATSVTAWRLLAGPSATDLSGVGGAGRHGFETQIASHEGLPYYAVQALGSHGQVLGTSSTRAVGNHLAIFGGSAFVAGASTGGLPAACYQPRPCRIATTIYAGRTVVARTGRERIAAGGSGILYFRLSGAGRSLLSRRGRLPVHVVARDASGTSGATNLTLVPFYTSGSGPHRGIANSRSLQVVGVSDFVNSRGVGGILAGCPKTTPCHVRTTLTVGRSVVARTGSEFIGPKELGYLIFTLTPQGRSMLAHARGNQLGVHVALSDGGSTAGADVALAEFR